MTEESRLITIFQKPLNQVALVVGIMIVFSLIDKIMPHHYELLEVNSGTWIIGTSMIFCFIILNAIVAFRTDIILPYWSKSISLFIGLLVVTYAWCYLLSGKHIDDAGGFSWLWIVLTMAYLVFFVIARSMKRIVDLANDQDKKLRGEE